MDGFCGQTTEHRNYRTQVPDWQKQNPRLKTQFRVAKCEKLWSFNGKWQSINGMLRSMKTMSKSDLRRPKSGIEMKWFSWKYKLCGQGYSSLLMLACRHSYYDKHNYIYWRLFCEISSIKRNITTE
ncbi:MAG: hypothetical protein LBG80_16025 [Bacteroidales bacterium]|nr:hypothetical protein [Bacteroidales bacterium]